MIRHTVAITVVGLFGRRSLCRKQTDHRGDEGRQGPVRRNRGNQRAQAGRRGDQDRFQESAGAPAKMSTEALAPN